MARVTGLEPAASAVTGRRSNQLSYTRQFFLSSGFFMTVFRLKVNQEIGIYVTLNADMASQEMTLYA